MKERGIATAVIVAVIVVVLVVAGVGVYFLMGPGPEGGGEEQPSAVEFQFVRKVEVGGGIFSGIIFANNHFHVSFEVSQRVYVREYDETFTATGEQRQLTSEGVSVADHQMIFADNHFYLVHSVGAANCLYLKKFDADWNEIKSVAVVENTSGGESTNDIFLYYANGLLYVGSTVHAPPLFTGYIRIRKYDQNLEFEGEFDLSDVSCVCGSSMILRGGNFIVASSDKFWQDASLIIMRYDTNWNFIDSKTISAVSNANERFPMGLLFENGRYFVSYTHQTGDISPPPGTMPPDYGDLILKAFDSDWNLLGQKKITDDLPANSANRVHLAWANNRIYVSYDTSDFKIIVKEYTIVS